MYDVVVCGSAVTDVYVKTHCDTIVVQGKKQIMYPLGSKIIIENKQVMTGGGGTNISTCLARLGLKTAFMGCIGKDREGDVILDFLKQERIRFIGQRVAKEQTGYSIILDSQLDDRTLLTFKGANNSLSFRKIHLPKTKWVYSSSLIGTAFETLKSIAVLAKRNGYHFAFNPSSYQAKMGVKKLKKLLSLTDLLIFNKEEAQLLTGRPKASEIVLARLILPYLHPDATLIITDGKHGALLYDGRQCLKTIPPKCKVIETTGAGDAFASTFLAAKILGHDNVFALKAAMENAKSVITHYGAKNILLDRRTLFSRVKKTKTKVFAVKK